MRWHVVVQFEVPARIVRSSPPSSPSGTRCNGIVRYPDHPRRHSHRLRFGDFAVVTPFHGARNRIDSGHGHPDGWWKLLLILWWNFGFLEDGSCFGSIKTLPARSLASGSPCHHSIQQASQRSAVRISPQIHSLSSCSASLLCCSASPKSLSTAAPYSFSPCSWPTPSLLSSDGI